MADKANDEKSELFNASMVGYKMGVIEGYFADFADTLNQINGYIQANVNASIASSVYGDLGGRLLAIWDQNASTFNDFHENFDTWSQVVAVISANNTAFAVDAQDTYRDNGGTLDGVEKARQFVSSNNGIANISQRRGFDELDSDVREVLDGAYRAATLTTENNNKYGGKTLKYTDAEGRQVEKYYDEEGILVGTKIGDKYYNNKGVKVDGLQSASDYKKAKEEKITKAKEEDEERAKNKSGVLSYEVGKVPEPGVEAANIARLDSGTGGRATLLDIQVDGVSLGQDGTITIKKGQQVKLTVQMPEEIEGVDTCKRTSAHGGAGHNTKVKQYNDPNVDKNNSSTYRKMRSYDWYITGTETGEVTLSQTALFSLTGKHKYGTYKGMCRVRVKIVD